MKLVFEWEDSGGVWAQATTDDFIKTALDAAETSTLLITHGHHSERAQCASS